jgi:hypothetical protein
LPENIVVRSSHRRYDAEVMNAASTESKVTRLADHLFISYAWEDGALAEWLALKLTAAGYRVWIDRFKLLGGESYPSNIDDAIRRGTFRMLALLSRHSLDKPNPQKERTLALSLARDKKIEDFLITLNVDGLRASDLNWMVSDLTFIPFESWSAGLAQLLKKLESITAPRPLIDRGRAAALDVVLAEPVLVDRRDPVASNWFPFVHVPEELVVFRFAKSVEKRALSKWAFYDVDAKRVIAFEHPPSSVSDEYELLDAQPHRWRDQQLIEGIRSRNIAVSLLRRSIEASLLRRGLRYADRLVYFPFGLVEHNRLPYKMATGRKASMLVAGDRKARAGGTFNYHLAPSFVVRDFGDGFAGRLVLRLHLTNADKTPLAPHSILARRKQIAKSWWNHQWYSRQQAVMYFMSEGKTAITIGDDPERAVVMSALPLSGATAKAIDEALLAPIEKEVEAYAEDAVNAISHEEDDDEDTDGGK